MDQSPILCETVPVTTDATSFGRAVRHHDPARETYASEAVDLLFTDRIRLVVDVGAGTGKGTSVLAGPGREVTAVDPDEAMLARLRERLPGVRAMVGTV